MKKILLTTLLVVCCLPAAYAQKGTVAATIIDAETQEGVAGAVLEVIPAKTPDKKLYFTSGYKGSVSIPNLAYGDYKMIVSFLGYNNAEQEFEVSAAKQNLGTIPMKAGVQIDVVVKEVKALRTSQKGDTVSYNAGAFKVTDDADVEGLLKKMPGITVSDGTVEAQGEEVKKIFVDGKEFFGEDVTTAIKSLPAQAVDRIEVYNKLSDAAEFSGMDDGEGYKALNIVTHENMRQGQFGKFYAGYGYDADTQTEARNKYIVGGNANIFSGDSRVSLIGLFNNVNQQNFSFEDILGVSGSTGGGRRRSGVGQYMVRPQSGVATVNAIGVNYSDTWGKRDQVTFQGSYFFNNTDTKNTSSIEKWYEAPMKIDTLTTWGNSDTRSYNHRFNARLEWKISENQNLMIRPSFSYQSNDPYSLTQGWQFGESGYSRTDNYNDALRHGYNIRTSAVYRAKLGKTGRTITVDGNVSYSDNTNNSNSYSNLLGTFPDKPNTIDPETGYPGYTDPATGEWTPYVDLRYLRNLAPSSSYRLRGQFTYTEPLSKYSQASFQYRASYEYQERDKKSYITGKDYSIAGLTPDPSLSNSYESGYLTQSFGPGFRYSKERNTFVANVYYQRSSLDGKVIREDMTDAERKPIRHNYNNVTYFMMGQLNINRENSLRLFVSSYTDNPSVTDLQAVYDVSDAQNISHGNPNLNPSYSHRVNFHYTNSNVEKGRTFMWMFSMQNTSDYVATHLVQGADLTINGKNYRPNYYSMPVNLDGYWSVRTHLSYGLPVGFLKCNFNVMAGVIYTKLPSIIGGTVDPGTGVISGGKRNDSDNMGYDFRTVLGSNISENVDFTLSWNGTYNEATNSQAKDSAKKNRYFNHTASGNMKFVFPLGFTFTASAAYTQYIGFTNKYDDSYVLCNAWIGKKIFRNKRGEIMVGVNDIFNQNKAFVRSTGSGYTQNATNSVIGRYYMVQFTYNLRRFGKRGSKNIRDYDGVGAGTKAPRRGMIGPGAGGPPPGMHRGPSMF